MDVQEERTLESIRSALGTVPFYKKQNLALGEGGSLDEVLKGLPLLTRDRIRPTLPKMWFPEGRDAKAELAAGSVVVIEAGSAESRVRILFEPRWWREQERRALAIHPRAKAALANELGAYHDAVLWVPEKGTGSCGSGDPTFEDRLEGVRLHVNSRQDPAFWTEPVMTRMLDEISVHETTALFADPFYLDVLARHAAILNRRLDVSGFIATMRARPTLAHRDSIGRVFQGTMIDLLAARETGTLFVEGADGNMHHAPFATHVELLPAKVSTPGAEDLALVVVTTLERSVQPLVRYVLGDLVQRIDAKTIRSVEGTLEDTIVRPDGALVTPGAIDRAIGKSVRAYQVNQVEPSKVEVEVVGPPDAVVAALTPLFAGMTVTARATTTIGAEPTGKYRTSRRRPIVGLSLSAAFEGA